MTSKSGKHVKNVWIETSLHDEMKEIAEKSKRTIKDTVEMCLQYGIPKMRADIANTEVLSVSTKYREKGYDEVSQEQTSK